MAMAVSESRTSVCATLVQVLAICSTSYMSFEVTIPAERASKKLIGNCINCLKASRRKASTTRRATQRMQNVEQKPAIARSDIKPKSNKGKNMALSGAALLKPSSVTRLIAYKKPELVAENTMAARMLMANTVLKRQA